MAPQKIKSLTEILSTLKEERQSGQKVVHCHGVFDLLHPGHIRHLKEAKKQGDKLVVSLTPDRFVNKGPGRPAFTEDLRLEQIAALGFVDYVVLNDTPDAVSIIKKIKPHVYVKGEEYSDHGADITGKISDESKAVEEAGGHVHYTNDIVFSSSTLINNHFDSDAKRLKPFIDRIKAQFTVDEVIEKVDRLGDLKVLVVGDAIIDEYQYVSTLGQSGKGVHMTARCLEREVFLGGSLIIANHLANFAGEVTLLTAVGNNCPHLDFIQSRLNQGIRKEFIFCDKLPTLTKRRYVLKDGASITKLFETYSSNETLMDQAQTQTFIETLKKVSGEFDLVLVSDFGNGLINPEIIHAISELPNFLAINTQINSGNRGYNVITNYHRADFISLNEPELRLAAHDRYSRLETLAEDVGQILHCPEISVTRGVAGILFYSAKDEPLTIPALTSHAIDRVGAGDSYFALAALSAAKGYPPILSGFLGSVAAAIDVQIIGNKHEIQKTGFSKYVLRLLK